MPWLRLSRRCGSCAPKKAYSRYRRADPDAGPWPVRRASRSTDCRQWRRSGRPADGRTRIRDRSCCCWCRRRSSPPDSLGIPPRRRRIAAEKFQGAAKLVGATEVQPAGGGEAVLTRYLTVFVDERRRAGQPGLHEHERKALVQGRLAEGEGRRVGIDLLLRRDAPQVDQRSRDISADETEAASDDDGSQARNQPRRAALSTARAVASSVTRTFMHPALSAPRIASRFSSPAAIATTSGIRFSSAHSIAIRRSSST